MTWNYRVIEGVGGHYIAEVYYDDTGRPEYYSSPIPPYGQSVEGLKADYEMMASAFDKPVLQAW